MACLSLGTPTIIDSADCSATRRVRSYFNNLQLPAVEELLSGIAPIDTNQLMQPGRTVEPYYVAGKQTVRTVTASWKGNPHQPQANTAASIVVHDSRFEKAQDITPVEAERFLGYPDGSTAGGGVTPKDRLSRLGAAWDVRTVLACYPTSYGKIQKVVTKRFWRSESTSECTRGTISTLGTIAPH